MLENKISFSIYMAHGGTNFGLWASGLGSPDDTKSWVTTSYDFNAPLNEAGWVTEKYQKTREVMGRFLQPGETLPEIPAPLPTMSVAPFRLTEPVPIFEAGLPLLSDAIPRPMEDYDQGYHSTGRAGVAASATKRKNQWGLGQKSTRGHPALWVSGGGRDAHGQLSLGFPF